MKIQEEILEFAGNHKKFRTSDVVKDFKSKYSRPYVSQQLTLLTILKKLVRAGSGPNIYYALPKNIKALIKNVHRRIKNQNLKEHEIIEELSKQTPFILILNDNVKSIFDYAFSEMLNNAIEHSESEFIELDLAEDNKYLAFVVRDFGIGVFRHVMKKYKLNSELDAIQELLKGKATSKPQSHSGEGIFFTSKISDVFSLESYRYKLTVDNEIKDVFVDKIDSMRGTKVTFKILLDSKKHLNNIFKEYQSEPDDYAFDKTEIHVKLYKMGTVHISRSQARRILSRLENFKKVILDFDQVPTIGQAFADEIFRVFKQRHPDIEFIPINTNETVNFMIKRVESI